MCIYVDTEPADTAVADDAELALLLAVTWAWHEPLPVAQAA